MDYLSAAIACLIAIPCVIVLAILAGLFSTRLHVVLPTLGAGLGTLCLLLAGVFGVLHLISASNEESA